MPRVLDWHSAHGAWCRSPNMPAGGDGEPGRLAAYVRMREIVADSVADFARRLPRDVARPRLLGPAAR